MELLSLGRMIAISIFCVGILFAVCGIVDVVQTKTAKTIVGKIIDYTQEYTARGFLWKAKVEYVVDNVSHFYITKARTTRRGTDEIRLYVNKKGKILEINHAFEKIAIGVVAICMAVVLLHTVSTFTLA